MPQYQILDEISISIHALLAESDQLPATEPPRVIRFLSTLSLRRATISGLRHRWASFYFYPRSPCGERQIENTLSKIINHFYPRSPCGERQNARPDIRQPCAISIHALLAESDVFLLRKITITVDISIHALLAESDSNKCGKGSNDSNFYPRSPCGERQQAKAFKVSALRISIHALLAESDLIEFRKLLHPSYFYPRSPCGERQNARPDIRQPCAISIHALLAESDCWNSPRATTHT